jgi:hypothetical protein
MLGNGSQKRYSRLVARTRSLPCVSSLDTGGKGFVTDAGIRIGTLLKNDNISFLIGAGASKEVPESSCAEVLLPDRPSVAMWRTLVHAGIPSIPVSRDLSGVSRNCKPKKPVGLSLSASWKLSGYTTSGRRSRLDEFLASTAPLVPAEAMLENAMDRCRWRRGR